MAEKIVRSETRGADRGAIHAPEPAPQDEGSQ